MSVHYKFKNTINYDAVKFDGVYISATDLKSVIAQQKKMSHSELEIMNEETKQVYSDDQMIPKNTNVVVSRLPFPQSNRKPRLMANQHSNNHLSNNNHHHNNHHHRNNSGAPKNLPSSSASSLNNSNNDREALELVSTKDMTEEEKIKRIQAQSTRDFDTARYPRGGRGGSHWAGGRGGANRPNGKVRPGYVCHRCNMPGHFIQDCKQIVNKVKRASGLPKDTLIKVDPKTKGAMLMASGEYAVPIIDHEAYNNPKIEKAPFFEDGTPDDTECSELVAVTKRPKLGFGVPNWRNISKSSQPDADRYSQYPMLEVRCDCDELVSVRERRLITIPMYAISTNVLCRHTKNEKDIYIPIEIGISCYSIEKGRIGKPYHCFIDAGPIPSGMVNESRDHMQATHKIPNPSKGTYLKAARKDYLNIYKELLKYARGGERTLLVPDAKDMAQVKGCLEWLRDKAYFLDDSIPTLTSSWTILPMVEYLASTVNHVYVRMLNKDRLLALHYIIKLHQENSTWDYDERIMCEYHRDICSDDPTKWCAQSCAIRAFSTVEGILQDLYRKYQMATNGQ